MNVFKVSLWFQCCSDFVFLFFTEKAKQMEDKMVQKLQEDVVMGDEDN